MQPPTLSSSHSSGIAAMTSMSPAEGRTQTSSAVATFVRNPQRTVHVVQRPRVSDGLVDFAVGFPIVRQNLT